MNPSALTEYMYVQENETKKFYCETGVDIIDTEMIHFIPESTFWKDIESTHTHTKEATRLGERRDAFQREAGNSVSSWKRFFSLPCTSTMHYHLQHKNKKYVLEDFNLAGKSIASTSVWKLKLGKFKWGTLDRP